MIQQIILVDSSNNINFNKQINQKICRFSKISLKLYRRKWAKIDKQNDLWKIIKSSDSGKRSKLLTIVEKTLLLKPL